MDFMGSHGVSWVFYGMSWECHGGLMGFHGGFMMFMGVSWDFVGYTVPSGYYQQFATWKPGTF